MCLKVCTPESVLAGTFMCTTAKTCLLHFSTTEVERCFQVERQTACHIVYDVQCFYFHDFVGLLFYPQEN